MIENALSKYKVITKIEASGVTYNTEDEVSPRYVIVFDEKNIEDVIKPVVQAKKKSHLGTKAEKRKHARKKEGIYQFSLSGSIFQALFITLFLILVSDYLYMAT